MVSTPCNLHIPLAADFGFRNEKRQANIHALDFPWSRPHGIRQIPPSSFLSASSGSSCPPVAHCSHNVSSPRLDWECELPSYPFACMSCPYPCCSHRLPSKPGTCPLQQASFLASLHPHTPVNPSVTPPLLLFLLIPVSDLFTGSHNRNRHQVQHGRMRAMRGGRGTSLL